YLAHLDVLRQAGTGVVIYSAKSWSNFYLYFSQAFRWLYHDEFGRLGTRYYHFKTLAGSGAYRANRLDLSAAYGTRYYTDCDIPVHTAYPYYQCANLVFRSPLSDCERETFAIETFLIGIATIVIQHSSLDKATIP